MSKSAVVRLALELYSERRGISSDVAVAFYRSDLDDALEANPKVVTDLLGATWGLVFDQARERLSKTNEARRVKRQEKKLQAVNEQVAQQVSKIDLSSLMANTKSGYHNIYSYGSSWRARVKTNGNWVYLPAKKLPEEAALDLYRWYEKHSPEEILPRELQSFYTTYKKKYPEASHEDALNWAKELFGYTVDTSLTTSPDITPNTSPDITYPILVSKVEANAVSQVEARAVPSEEFPQLLEDGFPAFPNDEDELSKPKTASIARRILSK